MASQICHAGILYKREDRSFRDHWDSRYVTLLHSSKVLGSLSLYDQAFDQGNASLKESMDIKSYTEVERVPAAAFPGRKGVILRISTPSNPHQEDAAVVSLFSAIPFYTAPA